MYCSFALLSPVNGLNRYALFREENITILICHVMHLCRYSGGNSYIVHLECDCHLAVALGIMHRITVFEFPLVRAIRLKASRTDRLAKAFIPEGVPVMLMIHTGG